MRKRVLPLAVLTALTFPLATTGSSIALASDSAREEIAEIIEDAEHDLRELAAEGAPSSEIDAVKAEIYVLRDEMIRQVDAGEDVDLDDFEDAVEQLVDDVEDVFEQSLPDSDDDSDDSSDDDSSDDSDEDEASEIAERYEDIEEAITKATRALDAAELSIGTDLIAQARATLADFIERASEANLTSRQLKTIRDDIRAIAKRFDDYLESHDDDSDDESIDDEVDGNVGLQKVLEIMTDKAEKFDGEKKARFEAQTEEFRMRYAAAEDDTTRRQVVEDERDSRIEQAAAQVVSLIERINSRLAGFGNVDATEATLSTVTDLQATLRLTATEAQSASTREDLRNIRNLLSDERNEIGRLFELLESLEELQQDSDDTADNPAQESQP